MTFEEAFKLARQKQQAGQLTEAIGIYRQILASHPDNPRVLNQLGTLACMGNRPADGMELFVRAVALKPDSAEFRNNLGSALFDAGRIDEAVTVLRDALKLQPDSGRLLMNLGTVLRAAGRIDQAIATIQRRLAVQPDDIEALAELARALGQGGHSAQAVDALRRAMNLRPDSIALYLDLGGALIADDQFDEAMKIYQRGAALAGDVSPLPAVAPTDTRVFAVCSIRNGPVDLLPHWLAHYTSLGVDQLLVGIFENVSDEARRQIDACAARWRFTTFPQQWQGITEELQESQRKAACRAVGATDQTWILHTDLDELISTPAPLAQIAAAAAHAGQTAIYGWLVDRVAADGSLPAVTPEPSLFEQFPIACRLTVAILHGSTQKLFLSRLGVPVSAGHHFARGRWPGRVPIGRPEQYLVHHFKWHAQTVPRLQWSLEQPNTHLLWRQETNRFLKWLETNGGRINVNDPLLKAASAPAPARPDGQLSSSARSDPPQTRSP